jgi:hypothetical protein
MAVKKTIQEVDAAKKAETDLPQVSIPIKKEFVTLNVPTPVSLNYVDYFGIVTVPAETAAMIEEVVAKWRVAEAAANRQSSLNYSGGRLVGEKK